MKYPVLAGGIAVSTSPSGTVKSMVQLVPANIDKLGAASAMSGSKRYELADDMQVYLWYKGQYYAPPSRRSMPKLITLSAGTTASAVQPAERSACSSP